MSSFVRFAALAAAAFVGVSFLLFAVVELRDGSEGQIQAIDQAGAPKVFETDVQRPNPEPAVERVRENSHSGVREAIDDVNDVLLSPFSSFTDFQSVWGERVAALFGGLLLYGGVGLMLANSLPKHRDRAGDWREATS